MIPDTGDPILDGDLNDFIDAVMSGESKELRHTLIVHYNESSPAFVNWVMDPVHFNIIQRLILDNYNVKYIAPRKTSMGSLDSHVGTQLPPNHREVYENWIHNVLKAL